MQQTEASNIELGIQNKPRFSPSKQTAISDGYASLGRKYFPALSQLEDVAAYRQSKADILSSAQILVLKFALSPEKLAKSGFLQLCQGFEILNKAERLELGKSSENVAHSIFGSVNLQLPTDK